MTAQTIQQKKAALATRAGVAMEQVGAIRLQLQKLQQEGVLVDVDFHGGHIFVTRATYQELGIPDGDVRRQRIRAGSKSLIPTQYLKKLRSLETRFRQSNVLYPVLVGQDKGGQYRALSWPTALSLSDRTRVQGLDKYSFQIGAFGSYRWVPFTAYEAWREEWDRLQDQLAALRARAGPSWSRRCCTRVEIRLAAIRAVSDMQLV